MCVVSVQTHSSSLTTKHHPPSILLRSILLRFVCVVPVQAHSLTTQAPSTLLSAQRKYGTARVALVWLIASLGGAFWSAAIEDPCTQVCKS